MRGGDAGGTCVCEAGAAWRTAADAWLGEQLLEPRPSRAVVVADVAAVAVPPAGRLEVDLVDDRVEAVEVGLIAREAHGLRRGGEGWAGGWVAV